jgi:hypothetical protein
MPGTGREQGYDRECIASAATEPIRAEIARHPRGNSGTSEGDRDSIELIVNGGNGRTKRSRCSRRRHAQTHHTKAIDLLSSPRNGIRGKVGAEIYGLHPPVAKQISDHRDGKSVAITGGSCEQRRSTMSAARDEAGPEASDQALCAGGGSVLVGNR